MVAVMRAPFRLALSFAVAATALAGAARPARAVVVERVVAVIGDRPILLSELRRRARPFLLQIASRLPPGPQQTAAETQVYKELIQKMIDDELEGQAADKAHVSVTSDEIDNAMRNIATAQNMTLPDLIKGAGRSGLSEQDYREELRRQILEGKMLQLRVKGRIRITEEDVKAMYERTLREERLRREYQPRWIVLRVPAGSSSEAAAERMALAKKLVQAARKGEDFATLAKQYSDDTATRENGGDLGIRAPQGSPQAAQGRRPTLAPELDSAVAALDAGQVTEPIKIADAIVIVQLVERQASRYRTFEEAKPEMLQRLQTEILEKAKRKWLDELKSHTHLDVRL
ncbi:Survival protein SurA precursor (Peptidyl-prolyl cis-trans isomerase SurA) [Minicystis rosea]|nr:Survival protein SurA precursor (Peptidyl-prolyl cis-trans isomerase SurA) [Minicystis rosea]